MNIDEAIATVAELSPVFDMTGIGKNRVIENEELEKLSKACDVIREKLITSDIINPTYLIEQGCADVVHNMVTVGFGMKAESAKRMREFRK